MTSVLEGSYSPLYICPCTGCLYKTCTCHSSWQNRCWCLTSLQSVHVYLFLEYEGVAEFKQFSMQCLTTVHSDQYLTSINHYHNHLLFIHWGIEVITVMKPRCLGYIRTKWWTAISVACFDTESGTITSQVLQHFQPHPAVLEESEETFRDLSFFTCSI